MVSRDPKVFTMTTRGGMIRRGEITDEVWGQIAPLLPEGGRRGGRWKDHRLVVNGASCGS